MGIQSTLFTGVSGLTTYSNVISIIGNNIANVNTPGFKEGRGNFSDILSQSFGSSGSLQIGNGVLMTGVTSLFTQGSFQRTNVTSDLAIDGNGFFIVRDPDTNALFYTRTGNFFLNREGFLVNPRGMILQGFSVDSNGNALPFVKDVNISGQAFPPKPTAEATININLNSQTDLLLDPDTGDVVSFDPTDPAATSNFSTALTLYDSLGNSHNVEVYFQKTADNTWNWYITARADDLDGMSGDNLVTLAAGEMTFTENGALDTIVTMADSDGPLDPPLQGATATFNFGQGAEPGQVVNFNFGTPRQIFDDGEFIENPAAPTDFEGTTQFASISATLFQSQDGFGSGVLQSFSIDENGVVQGLFSNGQTLELMQVALAKFPSPSGLNMIGQNLYGQSRSSGEPVVSAPGTSGNGVIVSNALEISNVDLSMQFVELIRAQQAFQANARVITTGDQLLTEVVNLKR